MADTLSSPIHFVHESLGINSLIWQTRVQSDGKILALGFDSSANKAILARFNSDGSQDTAFGSGGLVTLDGSYPQNTSTYFVQKTDGHLVVSTSTALYELNSTGGLLNTSSAAPYGSTLLPDGSLFKSSSFGVSAVWGFLPASGGEYLQFNTTGVYGGATQAVVKKLLANGSADTSFGQSGQATLSSAYTDLNATAAVMQPDGKILVLANHFISNGFLLFRLNANGSLDTQFGQQGVIDGTGGAVNAGSALALQSDGKILLAGTNTLSRYTSDGQLDTSFGSHGIETFPVSGGINTQINVLSNGKILLSGGWQMVNFSSTVTSSNKLFMAQINADGSLDTAFGSAYYDLEGSSGNDTFDPDSSIHYLNGGAGDDTLIERLSASDFTLTQRSNDWLLTSNSNPSTQISLTNIEHIKFNANSVTNGVSQANIVDLNAATSTSTSASSTAAFLQEKYNLSTDVVRAWIFQNVSTPQLIHDVFVSASVTSSMMADILQPSFTGITLTGSLVNQWFASQGVDGLA